MESEGGEDLSWFWRGWYLNNWKYDVAVDKIDVDHNHQQPRPTRSATTVEVRFKSGEKTRVKLPVETWLSKGTYVWTLENKTPIAESSSTPTTSSRMTTGATTTRR